MSWGDVALAVLAGGPGAVAGPEPLACGSPGCGAGKPRAGREPLVWDGAESSELFDYFFF